MQPISMIQHKNKTRLGAFKVHYFIVFETNWLSHVETDALTNTTRLGASKLHYFILAKLTFSYTNTCANMYFHEEAVMALFKLYYIYCIPVKHTPACSNGCEYIYFLCSKQN